MMSNLSTPQNSSIIMVIDDHVDNLKLLSDMLDEQGYEVRQSLNGLTALKSIELSSPDLILLDLKMPDMDGYTVCQKLKKNPKVQDIPVIFISASDEVLDKVKAFSVGGCDYISKPFNLAEVLARVENQLKVKRLQQALKDRNTHLESLIKTLEEVNQKLEDISRLDPLTQIGNRLHFNDCLEREWKRAMREEEPLGLILCDIDDFKLYNDTYGHLQGDRCLRDVAQGLKMAVFRGTDLVCRYGGEEFAIIVPNTDCLGAEPICQRIVEEFKQLKIPHGTSSVSSYVSVSVGFASLIPSINLRSDRLIFLSDKALYGAKEAGKNRFFIYQ
ncbi:two-component response regulator [Crocosphaera subtropica ATCC 51142]|uniref:Two-component response regulator n=1 Tax=Crocosphaera subtropica (strain ATCC 51142 / BH68) TaxID=43989 RepID=B1WQL5_CROS5|nr:diguanylate cyclase [Crocosphaera subtropica]ACB51726.1 two-component response regulator [Crocosphaera subtropica ATCC 51142]